MAIAFRNQTAVVGTGTNATPTEPGSAASNDIFWGFAICGNAATITIPAGWTSLYSGTATGGTALKYNLAWIRRGGSAPSLTWVISTSVYREVHVLAFSGVTTSGNPYEASTDGGSSSGTNPDCPAVTTVNANAMNLAVAVNFFGSGASWGAPSGYTIRTRNTGGDDCVIASKLVVAAGSENPAAFTGGGGFETQWTASVALQEAGAAGASSLIFPAPSFQPFLIR